MFLILGTLANVSRVAVGKLLSRAGATGRSSSGTRKHALLPCDMVRMVYPVDLSMKYLYYKVVTSLLNCSKTLTDYACSVC